MNAIFTYKKKKDWNLKKNYVTFLFISFFSSFSYLKMLFNIYQIYLQRFFDKNFEFDIRKL